MKFVKRPNYDFSVMTLDTIDRWKGDFETVRQNILAQKNETRKKNYSLERLNISEQEEVTVLYRNYALVAFSTLYRRDFYPPGVSRVLNRMWKDQSIRNIEKPFHLVSKLMLDQQLDVARQLDKKAVFISTEGVRGRWLQEWVKQANQAGMAWKAIPGKCHVAPGNHISCWQNVAVFVIDPGHDVRFDTISDKEWKKMRNLGERSA